MVANFGTVLHSFQGWWRIDDFPSEKYVLLISVGLYFHANDKNAEFFFFKTETTLVKKFIKKAVGLYYRG